MRQITRRDLLAALPALALAPRVLAQGKPSIAQKGYHHFGLAVSDVKRTVDFYQALFGMPVQARQGQTVVLRIGSGPRYMAISPAGSNRPSISHMGIAVDSFNVDRLLGVLAQHGVTKAEPAASVSFGDPASLSGGAMKARVRMRGAADGGAKDGTPELFFGDPDGVVTQLCDVSHCGGAGALGSVCAAPEPSPKKGLMAVKDISHFTNAGADANRSNQFYQDLFGIGIRSKQGASLGLAIGPTIGFLMFTGGAAGAARGAAPGAPPPPPRPGSINHVCMNMDNFKPDDVLKTLETMGITPRGDAQGPAGPLKHYISLRMPNRGGVEGGTPELYFTDPDGLLIQLQDVTYCGGGGYLGNVCT
jgi:catechol 2,3-dioxygenase-like lactoylglutathione lyase family enzyme